MRHRCEKPSSPSYYLYGERGIRVCDRWQDFALFQADMGHPPTPLHTLDRIDSDGHYEPGNCRWATPEEQSLNRRVTLRVMFEGRPTPVKTVSKVTGISYAAIQQRIKKLGWTDEAAVTKPMRKLVRHAR